MRLRSIVNIHKILFVISIVCFPSTVYFTSAFGQERKIDSVFLELDKKYRTPEQWSVLPFELEDPYKRIKNGPPLVNIIYKAKVEWLSRWIANPKKVVSNAKMPNLGLDFEEIKAVIVFLSSIAEKDVPQISWDDFLLKKEDDLKEDEYDKMEKVFNTGKGVWGRARCTICHPIKGVGGNVGVGPDLGEITTKINRNWLHAWLGNTKHYFPDTMMAQYRFTDLDVRGLVEFIMRDTQFIPEEKEDAEDESKETAQAEPETQVLTEKELAGLRKDTALIERGRGIVEKARCFVCHDIKGISELMPVVERKREGLDGFENLLYEIRCLSCHKIQNKGGTYAPNLTFAGSKIKMGWEGDFLQAPDIVRPLSQQMPKFNLTGEEAKIATGYIEKNLLIKEPLTDFYKEGPPTAEIIAAGEKLFYDKGCNTCHAENITKGGGVVGPNLATVGDRLQPAFILYHLRNPQQVNPQGVEPNFGLSDEELKQMVGFLVDHVMKKEGT